MRRKTIGLLTGVGLAGVTAGEVTTQSVSYAFPRLLESTGDWNLSSFDSRGGQRILDKVELAISVTMGADVMAENGADVPEPEFGVVLFATANARCGPLDLWVNPSASASGSAGPSDGIDQSGPDCAYFGIVSGVAQGAAELTSGLDGFMDRGDLLLSVWTDGIFGLQGNGVVYYPGVQINTGEVRLTYTWHDVPSPGSMSLACAGLACLGSRRRRPG